MNNVTTNLLADKNKAGLGGIGLTKDDLFDRIINLKFYAGERLPDGTNNVKDTYVIRSDWEIYYPDQNNALVHNRLKMSRDGYIRKCRMKPSIKVQYKQIATGTAIEIDIFVSNFFMLDSSGQMLMSFNNIGYPILKVEVQMGYWGQFAVAPKTWDEYNNFKSHDGAEVITCNVNYSQTDKLPPDATLHIHGYVGNCYGSPVTDDKQPLSIRYVDLEKSLVRDKSKTLIEDYCFQNVTRRFLRTNTFDNKQHPIINVDSKLQRMDKISAEQLGIKVFCTEALKQASKEAEENGALVSSSGSKVDVFTAGLNSSSAIEALNSIKSVIGVDCTFQALKDGNYIALLPSELDDVENLAKAVRSALASDVDAIKVTSPLRVDGKSILPAVYNITTDALCTITCPFFYFVDPFDVLEFKSRYALGGIVSYYANFNASEELFYVLWETVSFATVEDINECQITCTGSQSRRS